MNSSEGSVKDICLVRLVHVSVIVVDLRSQVVTQVAMLLNGVPGSCFEEKKLEYLLNDDRNVIAERDANPIR